MEGNLSPSPLTLRRFGEALETTKGREESPQLTSWARKKVLSVLEQLSLDSDASLSNSVILTVKLGSHGYCGVGEGIKNRLAVEEVIKCQQWEDIEGQVWGSMWSSTGHSTA